MLSRIVRVGSRMGRLAGRIRRGFAPVPAPKPARPAAAPPVSTAAAPTAAAPAAIASTSPTQPPAAEAEPTLAPVLTEQALELVEPVAPPSVAPTPAAPAAPPAPRGPADALIFRINRRQVPFLILLGLVNLALCAALVAAALPFLPGQPEAGVQLPPAQVTVLVTTTPPPPAATVLVDATVNVVIQTPTPGPSPTAPPDPFAAGGAIAFAMRTNGHTNLWATRLDAPGSSLVRLTAGDWDDRDPALSPDGNHLAFASHRDGQWDLYILTLDTGELTRLTATRDFEANPSWSPDGLWLAYEAYVENNVDVYILNVTGEQRPVRITYNPNHDFSPTWSPDGRHIAWVSARDGSLDIFTISLDDISEDKAVNLTQSPDIQEDDPAYSPDGSQIAFHDDTSGLDLIYTLGSEDAGGVPVVVAQGRAPAWGAGGASIIASLEQKGRGFVTGTRLGAEADQPGGGAPLAIPMPGVVDSPTYSQAPLPATLSGTIAQAGQAVDLPLWRETTTPTPSNAALPAYSLVPLDDVEAPLPELSDRVDEAFVGLRRRVIDETGWDFLATLDDAAIDIKTPVEPGLDPNDWHKAGRAFDISQAPALAGWVVIEREDTAQATFWRVFIRTRQQDGSQGEPLRRIPWEFQPRFSGDPSAYDQGGRYRTDIPQGYFVDFTQLAEDFGWERVPATDNWRSFYPGVLYWEFRLTGGLQWYQAMSELYPTNLLASPTPFLSPTPTSTPSTTPTVTLTPTRTMTPTRSKTPTRSPTPTQPTATSIPTETFTPAPTWTLPPLPTITITPTFDAAAP
jgi:TolB protein